MGASAFLKSVDFRAFAVNVKTIAPKKYLYQSGHAIWLAYHNLIQCGMAEKPENKAFCGFFGFAFSLFEPFFC